MNEKVSKLALLCAAALPQQTIFEGKSREEIYRKMQASLTTPQEAEALVNRRRMALVEVQAWHKANAARSQAKRRKK